MQNINSTTAKLLMILNDRVSGISLSDALLLISEITAEFEKETDTKSQLISQAKKWAEGNFTYSDLTNYKIRAIKELRDNFSGLSLKESKDIVDVIVPRGTWNYFE